MAKRKGLSKKNRFEVFKRDAFSCQYCGATPPAAALEVDHIEPVSNGGSNEIENLITACFDCNRGKGAASLSVAPSSLIDQAELIAEKEDQLREYKKLLTARKRREARDIKSIDKVVQEYFPDCCLADKSKQSIRLQFLPKLNASILCDNMHRACIKRPDNAPAAFKYFCGICWGMIKGFDHA